MRAKVIIVAVGIATLVLLPAVYFHFKPDAPAPASQPAVADNDIAAPVQPIPKILGRVAQQLPQEGLPNRPSEPNPNQVDHQTYVIQRRAELINLGASDDPANLKIILSEMENPEPELRKAALDAAVQFGSKDAIPTLQNEINWATDPQEKVDIQKAIDYLQLPSFGSGGVVSTQ